MGIEQALLNVAETALLYSLVACGFYFASISTRHFCFATAIGAVACPSIALLEPAGSGRVLAALGGLIGCMAVGVVYQAFVRTLSSRGAREGVLLIISLAILAIGENLLEIFFGNASQTLWLNVAPAEFLGLPEQQLLVIVLGSILLATILVLWRLSLMGKLAKALIESRLNLSLRGFSVPVIELYMAAAGFGTIGLAGLLWTLDGRLKPSMCTDIAIIGAIAFIVGTFVDIGIAGLVGASLALSVIQLLLSITLEGDWSMTAMLVLLAASLLLRSKRLLQFESAQ